MSDVRKNPEYNRLVLDINEKLKKFKSGPNRFRYSIEESSLQFISALLKRYRDAGWVVNCHVTSLAVSRKNRIRERDCYLIFKNPHFGEIINK